MTSLTVRGFDADLEGRLREVARQHRCSLNQAALLLLRRGAGLEDHGASTGAVGDSLDAFFGGWTEDEARAFRAAVADFEQVDDELWR